MVALRRFFLFLLAGAVLLPATVSPAVAFNPQQYPPVPNPAIPRDPSPVHFIAPDLSGAGLQAGQAGVVSFCDPAPTNVNDLCSGSAANPSGGQGPYHFVLDTMGGFPPMGMVLHPNGLLTGVPKAAGTTRFRVCAVDLSGFQSCKDVSITVAKAPPANGKKTKGTKADDGTNNGSASGPSNAAKIAVVGAVAGGAAIAVGYAANLASQSSTSASGCDPSKAPIQEINYYCFGSTRDTTKCNQYIAQYDSFCKSCGFSRFDATQGGCR